MIDFALAGSGVAVGLAVAAPIGPVNLIVIRRTLRFGGLNGFVSGAGAASGDGVFAAIAAFGVTAAMDFIVQYETLMQFVGGLFLIGLGARTFFMHPHISGEGGERDYGAMARVFAATFALTLTNPATMLGFIALFSGIAGLAVQALDYRDALTLVFSVVLGSMLWWAGLSRFVSLFRARMSDRLLETVNRVSGGLIAAFGILVLGRVLIRFFS